MIRHVFQVNKMGIRQSDNIISVGFELLELLQAAHDFLIATTSVKVDGGKASALGNTERIPDTFVHARKHSRKILILHVCICKPKTDHA